MLYVKGCEMLKSTRAVLLVTAAVPTVWGTTYAVTTEFLPPGRPLLAAALRALPAGLVLLLLTRRLPAGGWWWRSAVLGTLNIGAFFALLFISAYRLPGGVAAVLGAAGPLIVAGLSVVLLAQRLSARTLLAGVMAAGGVALTVLTAQARLDPIGVLAGVAGAASMALGLVLTKRWGRPAPVLVVTGWQLTAGGLLLLPLALVVEGLPATLTAVNAGGYLYLSLVGTAAAYTLWFRGLERLPATSVSLLGQLSPLVATTLGWAALGQRLTPVQVLGMALALGGVVAGQTGLATPRPPSPPAARHGQRAALRQAPRAAARGGGAAGRRGAAPRAQRVRPPAGPGADRAHAEAAGARGDRPLRRGAQAGRRLLPGGGPAPGHRGGPARRPRDAHPRRAGPGLDPDGVLWIRNALGRWRYALVDARASPARPAHPYRRIFSTVAVVIRSRRSGEANGSADG